MSKKSIFLILICIMLFSSFSCGADKLDLDKETTLTILNTVMEFYYAMHNGNEEKIQFLTLEELPAAKVTHMATNVKLCQESHIEFTELTVSPDNPSDTVAVIITFWPIEEDSAIFVEKLITLKKVGDFWKIKLFTEPNLP
ncbi:MAG: hypothetical protein JRD68_01410 [Deltaproteobacteria bacterium]|nr:hypothetical protein [Deltaproteobacteria bacterium]